MSSVTAGSPKVSHPQIAGMPRWLAFSLLTILLWGAWGAVSKLVSDHIDADTNQVFFTIGLLPLIAMMWMSRRVRNEKHKPAGMAWAFLTGILGGTGNLAFFHAFVVGGKASIVTPVTALFPLVTVILAVTILRERIGNAQKAGLALALIAIYLLSM